MTDIGGLQIGRRRAAAAAATQSRKGSGAAKRGGVQRAPKGLVDHRHRRRRGRALTFSLCSVSAVFHRTRCASAL